MQCIHAWNILCKEYNMPSKSTYYVKMLVQNLIDLDTDTKDTTSAHFRDVNSKLLIQC